MSAVVRLVTFVDVDDRTATDTVSVSARHEVELADGSRVLLLDDRGWGSSGGWATTSIEDMRETTRVVVGPDEPADGRSYEAAEAAHWAMLQRIAQQRGVTVDSAELKQLRHDVVLGRRVLDRIGAEDTDSG